MADAVRSPLAESHAAQGATLGEFRGALVPAHFGDPVAEHRAVRDAAGIFDFSFRAQFAATGQDRVRFLHRIVSNDIQKLQPGQGTYATLLNPQGHILVDFNVYCAEDSLFIETDADLREKAMAGLQRYIIADRVKLEPLEVYALAFEGPRARGLLEKILSETLSQLGEHGHGATTFAGPPVRVVRASSTGEDGYEVWSSAEALRGLWNAAWENGPAFGARACGFEALETLRIEAGLPRYGPDFGEDTIPLEANLASALSFTKGCYIGQEIVERARSRGHVNWKLAGLFVESPQPPGAGEKIVAEGKEIGEVTSACVSPTLGRTIALAYLRREVAEPGTRLATASGVPAEVAALPFYRSPTVAAG